VSAEEAARKLAEEWKLEFREAHTVAVDPRALALLDAADCRRLRAVPLSTTASGAVIALAEPSEERFAGVRALTGEKTNFVIITETTLDALLSSRIFGSSAPAQPTPPPQPAVPAQPESDLFAQFAPPPQPAPPVAAAPVFAEPPPVLEAPQLQAPQPQLPAGLDPSLVEALVSALADRLPVIATPTPPPVAPPAQESLLAQPEAEPLLSHGSDTVRRDLRETKEQLSVAHAEIDQNQRRIGTLESELNETRALLAQARNRLKEAADALDVGSAKFEDSNDFR
jgi:hypothetical protein